MYLPAAHTEPCALKMQQTWQAFQAAGLQVVRLPTEGHGAMLWQALCATLLHMCCKRVAPLAQVGSC